MQCVLYKGRNWPKQHGYSLAQLMFGKSQQLLLPQPDAAFSPIDIVEAAADMDKKFDAATVHYDRDKVNLSALQPGQSVLVQCEKSKKWDRRGEIIEVRPDGLSYLVGLEGKVIIRGRAMLKLVFDGHSGGQVQVQDQNGVKENSKKGSCLLLQCLPLQNFSDAQKDCEKKKKQNGRHRMFQLRQRGRCRKIARVPADADNASETNRGQRKHYQTVRWVFSLINIQWASFATGATAIIVCALIASIICFWIWTKNICRSKMSHAQLLDVLRRSSGRPEPVPDQDARFPVSSILRSSGQVALHSHRVDFSARGLSASRVLPMYLLLIK